MKLPEIHLEEVVLSILFILFASMIFIHFFDSFISQYMNKIPDRFTRLEGMECMGGCDKESMESDKESNKESMGCKKSQ
tara:strand:+ start:752 stop:988 length:237 start_codon:yes stop_codon:yes gene_type:complete